MIKVGAFCSQECGVEIQLKSHFFVLLSCCGCFLFTFSIERFYMITVRSYWCSLNKTNKTVGMLNTVVFPGRQRKIRPCLQATMLVFQTNPVGVELFSYVTFFIAACEERFLT